MGTVSRQFGKPTYINGTESAIIYKGTIDDASVVTLELEPSGLYELFTAEYTASTGAYRGHRSRLIKAPEADLFGTTASATVNESASTNAGVTITMNADSSISLSRSSATYAVKYVLRRVGTNIGNVSSAITTAEAAAQAAQNYASEASTAVEHYPKIENGYWYVWDVQAGDWIDTGVEARGISGVTPNLTVGDVTTGQAGSEAEVTITGTAENPVLNMTIPQGIAGGTQKDLLWTNPSPNTAFGAQTIQLDMTGYDAFAVIPKLSVSQNNQWCPEQTFPCDNSKIFTLYVFSYSSYNGGRNVIYHDDGIEFQAGNFNGSASNNYCIPYQIYGIKGINATPTDNVPLQMKLLWTNPSPNAAFAAQTVSINLSDYDYIKVFFNLYNDSNKGMLSTDALIDETEYNNANYIGHVWTGSGATRYQRKFYATSTGVQFEVGIGSGTANNNCMIPYKIYGIKGIT